MRLVKSIFCAAMLSTAAFAADAGGFAYTFVGSWQVFQGPAFDFESTTPSVIAYTAQEAAALQFGGSAADYAISTSRNTVDHRAFYSVLGPGEMTLAENYTAKFDGKYYFSPIELNGQGDQFLSFAAASAYVSDGFVTDTNYAFRITAVPEPDSLALLLAGLGVVGGVARRRAAASLTS